MTFLSAIVLLGILIFVHELGHFLFAKMMDVKVLKFSLGFGPRLIGRKYGETEYLISAFPLGGYVKMLGEDREDEISDADKASAGGNIVKAVIPIDFEHKDDEKNKSIANALSATTGHAVNFNAASNTNTAALIALFAILAILGAYFAYRKLKE